MLSALHTISTYPFDLKDPVFSHYPAMKFGHRQSICHFAELLTPMALHWIAQAPSEDRSWVLTSPPLQGLPCGANLVCRAMRDILAKSLPDGLAPRLDTLDVQGSRTPIGNKADFERYNEYSKQDLKTRQDFHLEGNESATYDLAGFAGRRAIFVNDINVTGTQLGSIESLLRGAGVRSLNCLLIVNVDRRIGCEFPQLENEINTSRFAGLEEFTFFLRDCEFRCTGKLISRLMSYDMKQLVAIFGALGHAKREILHRAILEEGLYGGAFFRDKMCIVERAVLNG